LKASLSKMLGNSILVVLGYGGWKDIVMSTLQDVLLENDRQIDVLWAFYSDDEERSQGHPVEPGPSFAINCTGWIAGCEIEPPSIARGGLDEPRASLPEPSLQLIARRRAGRQCVSRGVKGLRYALTGVDSEQVRERLEAASGPLSRRSGAGLGDLPI
jgi:hypothetical protein